MFMKFKKLYETYIFAFESISVATALYILKLLKYMKSQINQTERHKGTRLDMCNVYVCVCINYLRPLRITLGQHPPLLGVGRISGMETQLMRGRGGWVGKNKIRSDRR